MEEKSKSKANTGRGTAKTQKAGPTTSKRVKSAAPKKASTVSTRTRTETELKRRAQALSALQETVLDITRQRSLPDLLNLIVERAANLLNAASGGMYLTEPEKRIVRCVVSYNTLRDFRETVLAYGEGAAGLVAETGRPLMIEDYGKWSGRAKVYEEKQPFEAVISAPMIWQEQVIGVIHVLREEKFTQDDLDLLILFANHAAVAVENARLYDSAQQELAERKRAETALRTSEEEYHSLFENMEEGFAYCKMIFKNGKPQDWLYLAVNNSFETLTGLKNVIGKRVTEAIPGIRETDPELFKIYGRVSLTGKPEKFEMFVESLAMWFSVSVYSPEKGFFAAVFDVITERKQVEDLLREAEAKYRSLVERLPQVVYTSEMGVNGAWFYVSPQIESLLGFTPQEWLADPGLWYRQSHPNDRDRQAALEDDAFATGKPFETEYRMFTKDGREIWVRDSGFILPSQPGKPSVVQGVMTDVTDRKRAEQVQFAIYRIAEAAQTTEDLPAFYEAVYQIICGLMPAANFYITLYDPINDLFNVAYKRDEGEDESEWMSYKPGKGLGAYILRTGKPILTTPGIFERLEKTGEVEILMRRMVDYIGVPLKSSKGIIGVMATQTYTPSLRLTEADKDMMVFVSTQVATTIERKRAEQALVASESELRALFASMQDVVLVIDRQGEYRKIAPTNPALLVKPPEELLGKNLRDVFPAEQAGTFLTAMRQVLETRQSIHIEYELLIGERPIWFAASISPMDDENTVWVARDITARKQAEEALRTSEERFHTLYDNATIGLYRTTPDGRILMLNPAGVRMLGYGSFDEIAHRDLENPEFQADHPRKDFREKLEREGILLGLERKMIKKDGSIIFVRESAKVFRDENGKALYYDGSFEDVTDRVQAEEKLRATTAKLETLIQVSPLAITLVDLEGHIQLWNPSAERMFGWADAEVFGQPNPIVPADRRDEYRQLSELVFRGNSFSNQETVRQRRDGLLIDVSLSSAPLYDNAHNVIGRMAIIVDITERKRAEKVQRSIYEIARAAVNTKSLDELYATIHNILQNLLPTQYFYIALYDREKDLLSFPYFQDALDVAPPPGKPGHGLTAYVLRTREPLLTTREVWADLIRQDQVELVGADSIEWLGVPLIAYGQAIGVMVVQSYDEAIHFSPQDLDVMTYVSTQVASAIERKRGEEALKESEERFHSLFDNATVGMYRATPDGHILLSNLAGVRMLGYDSFDEIAQQNPEEGRYASDYPRKQFLERMEREGTIIGLESIWKRKDGSTMYVRENATAVRDKNGNILYYDGAFEDITERKHAEDALKRSESFTRSIVENEPECVKILGPGGVLRYMNPAGLAMIEVEDLGMVLGQSVYPIIVPEYRKAFEELVERVLGGEPGFIQFETIGMKGTRRWLDTHAVPLLDDHGQVESLLGLTRDITQRKQAESLQDVVYRIAKTAESTQTLNDLFPQIHQIISSVMPAENFFITLYDEVKNLLQFPYFKDVQDEPYLGQFEPGQGLTAYVLRTGKSLLCTQAVHDELERQGAVKLLGVPSKIWLGVPLIVEGKTIGVMVVQHYSDPEAYGLREQYILEFVSSQVAITIRRKQAEEALRESEERYRTLFSGMLDGIYRSTHTGKFVDVNPAMLRLFGYDSREEMLDLDIKRDLYFAPEERDSLFLDTGQEKVDVFRMRRKNGTEIWVEDHGRYVHDEQGNVIYHEGILRDVSERVRAEREIKRLLQESQQRLRQVEALHSIDLAIGSSMDLRTTLRILLSYVKSLLVVDAANILLFNPNSQSFEFAAGTGYRSRVAESALVPMGHSFAGKVALERRVLQFTDPPELLTGQDFYATWKNEGFASYTGIPLIAKGELKGVLEIYHRSPFQAEEQWMDLLQNFSTQAAIAIDNAQLFNDLQRSNFELSLAYDATIEGWSRALELRDRETEGHAQHVTTLTLELARIMGMRDADMVHIRRGALLHDIGKMGIPDSILLKPGALTDAEWEVMRLHPVYANEMLTPIAYLRPALDIPYCHHENWDGTGYPRGLKAEEIPPAARIFTVADAFDSLTRTRSYRKAWTKEKVLEYIKLESGKRFDPKVVDVFLDMLANSK
jgi:PAS domain S-box-containing protein